MATLSARGVWWTGVLVSLTCGTSAPATAASLESRTLQAYQLYVQRAREAFLSRMDTGGSVSPGERGLVRPVTASSPGDSSEPGQIVKVPGGLVHHWAGALFTPGVDLDRVLGVAQAYDDYAAVYGRIIASHLLQRDGNTFRVFARVKEDAGTLSAILDVWTVVTYERTRRFAHSFGAAREIRQVKHAGESNEQLLLPGHDSGYLWRADTFTRFIERDGGVHVELETVGSSRRFPPLLGWIIEPVARRIGRSSVERTLVEFRDAVLANVL